MARTTLAAVAARKPALRAGLRRRHHGRMPSPDTPVPSPSAPASANRQYITETQAFFASRAATWDTRFGDDMPAYAAAVARAGIRRGGVAIDVGCGTGRALPALRQAVGQGGTVIAADLT